MKKSPTIFETKITSMMGTMSCMAPVVSITNTAMLSVIRVAPPREAAAPRMLERGEE